MEGNTALHIAASSGFSGAVKLLIDKGARLDVRNNKGLTPIKTIPTPDTSNIKGLIEEKSKSLSLLLFRSMPFFFFQFSQYSQRNV